jgi:hypothetical protein
VYIWNDSKIFMHVNSSGVKKEVGTIMQECFDCISGMTPRFHDVGQLISVLLY